MHGGSQGSFSKALWGAVLAFGIEYVFRLRSEVKRLQNIEGQMESAAQQRENERKLWEYELLLANPKAAIAEVEVEVWGGAFNEAQKSGHFLPLEASERGST
jgi:hypothetical protein